MLLDEEHSIYLVESLSTLSIIPYLSSTCQVFSSKQSSSLYPIVLKLRTLTRTTYPYRTVILTTYPLTMPPVIIRIYTILHIYSHYTITSQLYLNLSKTLPSPDSAQLNAIINNTATLNSTWKIRMA